MIRRCLVVALVAQCAAGLPGFGKKKEEDDTASLLKNFDPNAGFAQMLKDPNMVAEMQQMLKDPNTMDEVRKLVADPEFKKKIETFQNSENFEGAKQMFGELMSDPKAPAKMNAAMRGDTIGMAGDGALGAEGARAAAAQKAQMDMEYEKYKESITGAQSAQKGLSMLSEAAKDPSMLMDSLNALKDPEMMKEVQEMMADPEFQREMQKIMADPSMMQAMQQSKEYIETLSKDPKRLEQVQSQMEGLLGTNKLAV